MPSLFGVLAVVPLGLLSLMQTPARPPQRELQVVVVVSQDAPPYRAALSSFQRTLGAETCSWRSASSSSMATRHGHPGSWAPLHGPT